MKRAMMTVAIAGFAIAGLGDSLFPRGGFDSAAKALDGDAIANGGRVSLFVENGSWNRCGRLELTNTSTNRDGSVDIAACAFIGGDGKAIGVPVAGDTLYDFSFEVRSDDVKYVGVGFQDWKTGVWAKDSKLGKTSLGGVYVRPGWSRYAGTFRTHPGAARAVLALRVWQSTKFPPVTLKVGDSFLFDNVRIERARDLAKALLGDGTAAPVSSAERVKSVRTGEPFDDFLRLSRKAGTREPFSAPTRVTYEAGEKALRVSISCEEPRKVSPGTADNVWAADALELFFGPAPGNPDRTRTQFSWNPAGARTAIKSGTAMRDWDGRWRVETRQGEKGYVSVAEIPYELLGFERRPEAGETIAINVGRTRAVTREWGSWAPVKEMFGEVEHFGRLVFGSWNDALKRTWASKETAASREEFERTVQKIETERQEARFRALKDRPFTVARVPLAADFACPFVPRESFEPEERIEVKAAVNEVTGVPVAILNLTGRTEEYVVRLETCTDDPAAKWRGGYNGRFGLEGLEPERVTVRKALRFKDTDQAPCSLRLDPLPSEGDLLTVSVPPKEAGLVWIDFNLLDAKPGRYAGRLRVMPLGEAATFEAVDGYNKRQYAGKMQDVPFTLDVRPIVLPKQASRAGGFFQFPIDREQAKMMVEAGASEFSLSPWSVAFAFDPKSGKIDLARPLPAVTNAVASLRNQLAWARAFGVARPTFFVGFAAYDAANSIYGRAGLTMEERVARFVEFVKGARHLMRLAGVGADDFHIETFDEPHPDRAAEMLAAHKAAKAAFPDVNLTLTMGAKRTPISFFKDIADFTDAWILWDSWYFQQKDNLDFNAEQLAKGKKIWHYTCSTSPRTPLYREYRLHAWFGAYHGLSGNQIFWFADNKGGYGQQDFKICTFGGLVYRNFSASVPSLRYMNLRQGVQDIKYLDTLREVAGGEPEVKAFLREAVRKVMLTELHDQTTADRMRDEAARLIIKYRR